MFRMSTHRARAAGVPRRPQSPRDGLTYDISMSKDFRRGVAPYLRRLRVLCVHHRAHIRTSAICAVFIMYVWSRSLFDPDARALPGADAHRGLKGAVADDISEQAAQAFLENHRLSIYASGMGSTNSAPDLEQRVNASVSRPVALAEHERVSKPIEEVHAATSKPVSGAAPVVHKLDSEPSATRARKAPSNLPKGNSPNLGHSEDSKKAAPKAVLNQEGMIISHEKKAERMQGHQAHHVRSRKPRNMSGNSNFTSLPVTKFITSSALKGFKPLHTPASAMGLVSFKDACFCTQREKFILLRPRTGKENRFPPFLTRNNLASLVLRPDDKESVLAFQNQNQVNIPGTTVLWRGRSFHTYQKHTQASLIPIRSLLDLLAESGLKDLKVAAESFAENNIGGDTRASKLQDYYLGDVPIESRIDMSQMRPNLICFQEVHAIGSEFEGHVRSATSYDGVKDLFSAKEASRLSSSLEKTCASKTANKRTVWIMGKHQNVGSGNIENIKELVAEVEKELIHSRLDDKVDVRIMNSPGLKCPSGTARAGCFESDCSIETDSNLKCAADHPTIFNEAVGFNKATFVISASGPANSGWFVEFAGLHIGNSGVACDIGLFNTRDSSPQRFLTISSFLSFPFMTITSQALDATWICRH